MEPAPVRRLAAGPREHANREDHGVEGGFGWMAGQFGHNALLDARPMERVEKILKNKAFFSVNAVGYFGCPF